MFESYAAEIGILYPEISEAIRKDEILVETPRSVSTSILHFYSKSMVYREPYGVSLIIGPWNYPFQLTIAPLDGRDSGRAIARCSNRLSCLRTPRRSSASMIAENFDPAYITVVEGGVKETQALLKREIRLYLLHRRDRRGEDNHGGGGETSHAGYP